jgi:hypothetical protein
MVDEQHLRVMVTLVTIHRQLPPPKVRRSRFQPIARFPPQPVALV